MGDAAGEATLYDRYQSAGGGLRLTVFRCELRRGFIIVKSMLPQIDGR